MTIRKECVLMENIISYLTVYFSDIYHVIFWLLVLIVVLFEYVGKKIRNSSRLKIWMKKHNIGKKY